MRERTLEGVDLSDLEERSGIRVEDAATRWLDDCLRHGLLQLLARRVLRTTPDGLSRLDAVLRSFVATRGTRSGVAA